MHADTQTAVILLKALDIQSYIDSGILELYVLGTLEGPEREELELNIMRYPEVKAELAKIELVFEGLAMSAAVQPSAGVKENLMDLVAGKSSDVQYPELSAESDYRSWLETVHDLLPESYAGGLFTRPLQHTHSLMQVLIVSTEDFPDEIHTHEIESFLILKGGCKCTIGEKERFMGPGDYMEIPLNEVHRVEIVGGPVTAIMQRKNLS